ncbi:MAG: glycolate oxidase subunit GlcF, partial [Rhodospirillaceae bacterium]|nr:glycolate oxidase subunit GlcF [Rhodospirillaceae bacterium]
CTFRCPTFRLNDDEWEGPRGRIHLIKKFFEGEEPSRELLPPAYTLADLTGKKYGENLQMHLDTCLTCRSCETSCPYDVKYGRLLDIARIEVEKSVPRPLKEKLMRKLVRIFVTNQARFTTLLQAGRMLRGLLPTGVRTAIPAPRKAGVWPMREHDRTMIIWQGCVQPALAPDINAATARVLDRFGIKLIPASDGCCGAISLHMAEPEESRNFMRKNIDALWPHIEGGAEALVLTASGCGTHFRDYGDLLADEPEYAQKARRVSEITRDVAEIVEQEWTDNNVGEITRPENVRRIAFQSSCSLQHGEKLNGVVEKILKRAQFKLVPVNYRFMCCGAAGAFAILQRPLSKVLRTAKMKTLLASDPEMIATANIGCLTHLSETSPIPVDHWIEVLDETFTSSGL